MRRLGSQLLLRLYPIRMVLVANSGKCGKVRWVYKDFEFGDSSIIEKLNDESANLRAYESI